MGLRGKKKKKAGASATGFFGTDGTHGERRRKEYGAFTSARPWVFADSFVVPKKGAKATLVPLDHWFWWNSVDPSTPAPTPVGVLVDAEAAQARKEEQVYEATRQVHTKKVEEKLLFHQKQNKLAKKHSAMVFGMDFGTAWYRFQRLAVAGWPHGNGSQTVLQVQPTFYGYAGRYNTGFANKGMLSMGFNSSAWGVNKASSNPEIDSEWDAHDMTKFGFRLDAIPPDTPKLFLRVYNTSKAECGSIPATQPAIAVTLSSVDVFDECAEWSPFDCDRVEHKEVTLY